MPEPEETSVGETLTVPCRYGSMTILSSDLTIGPALRSYGEWAEAELELLRPFIAHDAWIIDAGANVGTHSLAFASFAPDGRVFSFEPQHGICEILRQNVAQNQVQNIEIYEAALGSTTASGYVKALDYSAPANFGGVAIELSPEPGNLQSIPVLTVDDLSLARCDVMKIDVEGMEAAVIAGAKRTIAEFAPAIFCEAGSMDSWGAIDALMQADYKVWFYAAPPFNENNFRGERGNMFGAIHEPGVLALPRTKDRGRPAADRGWLTPVRSCEELQDALGNTPRTQGDPILQTLPRIGLIARIVRNEQRIAELEREMSELRNAKAREDLGC